MDEPDQTVKNRKTKRDDKASKNKKKTVKKIKVIPKKTTSDLFDPPKVLIF
jgi:hypothetical protein